MDDVELSEDQILGGDLAEAQAPEPAPAPAVAEPVAEAQPAPAPAPEAAPAPAWENQAAASAAFAQMQHQLNEQRRHNEMLAAQMQQAQQHAEPVELPGLLGDEEANWINQQLQQQGQQYQSQLAQVMTQNSLNMAQMRVELTKDQTGYGWDGALEKAWSEIQQIAPLVGVSPEQYAQAIRTAPDAGDRIAALAQANHSRGVSAQPVDMAKIEAAAYQKALADIQARSANPHNLAPPSVGSLPAVSVVESKPQSEDEILGSELM